MKNYIIKTFKLVLTIILFFLFIRTFVLELGIVNGLSMEPNFFDGNIFLVDKSTLLFRKPVRGDVVQFINRSKQVFIIKRIIGLPGETIIIKQGEVYVQDKSGKEFKLEENYKPSYIATIAPEKKTVSYQVPDNYYFVLGDNREMSNDSRNFGPIHRSSINGLVRFVLK